MQFTQPNRYVLAELVVGRHVKFAEDSEHGQFQYRYEGRILWKDDRGASVEVLRVWPLDEDGEVQEGNRGRRPGVLLRLQPAEVELQDDR